MGLFGFGEIIGNLNQPRQSRDVFTREVKNVWPSREDFRQAMNLLDTCEAQVQALDGFLSQLAQDHAQWPSLPDLTATGEALTTTRPVPSAANDERLRQLA
jgi:hypothetical protein